MTVVVNHAELNLLENGEFVRFKVASDCALVASRNFTFNIAIALMSFSTAHFTFSGINDTLSLDDRAQMAHNNLGVNVFFTWGILGHEGKNRLAVIAGIFLF